VGRCVLDVHDVGYEVNVASSDDYAIGDVIGLYIFTAVRDDAIVLYGFKTYLDREFFELLLVTPGVGPSTALGGASDDDDDELAHAIESDDAKKVATISGHRTKDRESHRARTEGQGLRLVARSCRKSRRRPERRDRRRAACLGYTTQEVRQALRDVTLPDDESEALRKRCIS
jgi:Holliday junction DNA helicase RuvA